MHPSHMVMLFDLEWTTVPASELRAECFHYLPSFIEHGQWQTVFKVGTIDRG